MQRLQSVLFTLLMVFAGLRLPALVNPVGTRVDSPSVLYASHGGSELPWFTPILVSFALLSVAYLYWRRHRPRPPADEEGPPELADRCEAQGPDDAPSGLASPPPEDTPTPRFRGLLRPVPIS